MKHFKKAACMLLALTLALGMLVVPSAPVQAASQAKLEKNKVHIGVKNQSEGGYTEVYFAQGDCKVKNVKSSSKDLKVTVSNVSSTSEKGDDENAPYGYANINLYAKKKGTYKVTFDVVNKAGETTSSHKITVYANNELGIKKMTLGGKVLGGFTTKTKGKLKVTMGKKMKLKSITMTTYNKKGKEVKKKIKNNKTITLGKYRRIDKSDSSWYGALLAETKFEITYQDGYSGETKTVLYTAAYCWPKN